MEKTETTQNEFAYSKGVHMSYGLGGFLDNFFIAAFTVRIIHYYETVVLLDVVLVGIAFVIFGVWNAINDPLLGYLSDKKFKFMEKWGRRFPWFAVGALAYAWVYLFIFTIPFSDQIGMFIWLVITICLFELLFSLWQINWLSLFPDKFRSMKERTRIGSITTLTGVLGIVMGILIPPLIIGDYENVAGYVLAGVVVSVVGFISALLAIPGMREDKALINRQMESMESEKSESFFDSVKFAVKNKNFMAYVITYLGHQVLTVMMLSSLPYWNQWIIGSDDADLETIMSAGFLVAVLLSIPFWLWFGRKFGNRTAFMLGTFMTTLFFIPMFFINSLELTTLFIAFVGFGIGAIWVLMYPCFSEVIDDVVVQREVRKEGSYTGIRTFIGRLSIVIQALAIAIVHSVTGFSPGAETGAANQTPLAQFGIRFLMAGLPMIFYFIGFLLMWKVYTLDKTCVEKNTELLQQKLL